MAHAAVASTGLIGSPTPEAIREQLGRIQGSSDFDVPERAHKFLGYVIEETLSGRAERIKAYSIALEVFGRDSSFDAQADPVVRIEAGRVRRALERYYLTAGRHDEIVITIPKGAYLPVFEWREAEPAPASAPAITAPLSLTLPWWRLSQRRMSFGAVAVAGLVIVAMPVGWNFVDRNTALDDLSSGVSQPDIPRLLIEPFEDLTGTDSSAIITRGLTEEIIGQIAKFKDLQVIEAPPPSAMPVAEINPAKLARYALLGSVRIADNTLRLTTRLRKLDDDSVLWAQSYDEDLKVQGILAVQAEIARDVTTALAQPYGVIFEADSSRVTQSPPNDWDAYSCTLAYYTYRHSMDWGDHSKVQGCLERTVKRYPNYASAWALLSILYVDDFRFRYPKTAPPSLELAMDAARRASDLDPRNARAQQALMMALFYSQEVTAALKVGAEAVEFNPNDTELLAEYGVRLGQSGDWEKGRIFITRALTRNPIPATYFDAEIAVNSYMVEDYPTAEIWIRKTRFQTNPLYHLVAAAIYGRLGRTAESERERDWLLANAPDLIRNIRTELVKRLARSEDREHFIGGLVLAGLQISSSPGEAE